jgi:hypothetical protein
LKPPETDSGAAPISSGLGSAGVILAMGAALTALALLGRRRTVVHR